MPNLEAMNYLVPNVVEQTSKGEDLRPLQPSAEGQHHLQTPVDDQIASLHLCAAHHPVGNPGRTSISTSTRLVEYHRPVCDLRHDAFIRNDIATICLGQAAASAGVACSGYEGQRLPSLGRMLLQAGRSPVMGRSLTCWRRKKFFVCGPS